MVQLYCPKHVVAVCGIVMFASPTLASAQTTQQQRAKYRCDQRFGADLVKLQKCYQMRGVLADPPPEIDWVDISGGVLSSIWVFDVVVADNGDIFAGAVGPDDGVSPGVWKSADAGVTWQRLNVDPTAKVFSLSISPAGHLFAGDWESPRIHRSTDGGASWQTTTVVDACGGILNRMTRFAFSPSGTILAGAGWVPSLEQGIFRSTDGGSTWANTCPAAGAVQTIPIGMTANADGTFAVGGEGTPIYVSYDDGLTWNASNIMQGELQTMNMTHDASGNFLAANQVPPGTTGGVWRSSDDGLTFSPLGALGKKPMAVLSMAPGRIFSATFNAGVLRSTDDGQTFVSMNQGLPMLANGNPREIRSITADKNGYVYVAAPAGGVFRTTASQ